MNQELEPISQSEIQPTTHRFTMGFKEENPYVPFDHNILGNKGFKLIEMTRMSLPVPEGFIITTDVWRQYVANRNSIPDSLWEEVANQMIALEAGTGRLFGDSERPLFVSTRSGAAVSMPGAMETILNIGICDATLPTLAKEIGPHTAITSYIDLIARMGMQAYGINPNKFIQPEANLDTQEHLAQIKNIFRQETGLDFPQNPLEQLKAAIGAIFDSWDNDIAKTHRKQNNISDNLGTAVTIQRMVWGNSQKEGAGSGVMLTRDPHVFSERPVVEFAPHAQGLAVVGEGNDYQQLTLEELPVDMQQEIQEIANFLEYHYERPQDIEFTYDGNRLWLLQTRDAPISPLSWFRFLEDGISKNQITTEEAERLISADQLYALLIPDLDPDAKAKANCIAQGIAVFLGNATGYVATSLEDIREVSSRPTVLVAELTQKDLIQLPEDVVGVAAKNGSIGSHIARIAAHIGFTRNIPIIFSVNSQQAMYSGELITIDGTTGEIFAGNVDRLENGSLTITQNERRIIKTLLAKRLEKPWDYVTPGGDIKILETLAKNAYDQAQVEFDSPKAQEIAVLRTLIDPEISIEYTPVKPQDRQTIQTLLTNILKEGNDATVRTCHYPLRPGSSPWVLLTKVEDVDRFFQDASYSPKYGGYPSWVTDSDFTEAIVGRIPKDKLNPNPTIQREHCAWTLTCTDTGVILQIRPFSSQLRGHEEAMGDTLITVETSYDPKKENLRPYTIRLGDSLKENEEASAFAQLVAETIFHQWWDRYQLPQRVAAIARVFPQPDYAIPVLEGQARIKPDGTSWCKIYGIKTDKQN